MSTRGSWTGPGMAVPRRRAGWNQNCKNIMDDHFASHRADEKTSNMDPEQLDFDPEEDDETMLRLKALETQVFCLWKK